MELMTRKEDAKIEYLPLFPSWLKRTKTGLNLHSEYLEIAESHVDAWIFRFRFRRCQ